MNPVETFLNAIDTNSYSKMFETLYPADQAEKQPDRLRKLSENYGAIYGIPHNTLRLFSAPGRTEVGGNHTDHQNGNVLAAAVNLDAICLASANNDMIIRIKSEGYKEETIDLSSLELIDAEKGTTSALIRGICSRLQQLGYQIGGFDGVVTSDVPAGSGLSSSACYENLITTVLSGLYNDNSIDPVTVAQIGQYSENVYFDKPSGLMDQAASSVGGFITIDFKDNDHPIVKDIPFDFASVDHHLCIVDTFSDHADLTDDYTAIPEEMGTVAAYFGKKKLREVDPTDFFSNIASIRKVTNDRGLLRAIHFFGDNERVLHQVQALEEGHFDEFKKLVVESGLSSFCYLQNVFSPDTPESQGVSLALALSEHLLAPVGGAWRVHGGGFAGTIQAFVPTHFLDAYAKSMNTVFGEDACHILSIRPVGGVEIKAD